jgi:hypothetical protein
LGLGVFLIVLAPMLRWYAAPRLALAPLDQYSKTVSTAPGASYFDLSVLKVQTGQDLTATRQVRGDVKAGNGSTAVWDVFVSVENPSRNVISANLDRVAFDRHTSEAVNCCKEAIDGKPVKHEGISYKFPFGAEQKTYQYFDTTLRKATPMRYSGTTQVGGLTVYRYVQTIPPTQVAQLQVPGSLVGSTEPAVTAGQYYSNVRTVWVEPTTGVIVKGQEKQLSTLRDSSGQDKLTLTQATLTFTPKTVAEQAKTAKDGKAQITLISTTLPLVSLLLGLILGGLGLWLLLSAPRGATGSHAPRAEPRTPVGSTTE